MIKALPNQRGASFAQAHMRSGTINSGSPQASMYRHANGVRRVTAIQPAVTRTCQPIEPLIYLRTNKVLDLGESEEWLVELTFDSGPKNKVEDLRPALPLLVRY